MQAGLDYIIVGVLDEDARMDLAFVNMRSTTHRILDILEDQVFSLNLQQDIDCKFNIKLNCCIFHFYNFDLAKVDRFLTFTYGDICRKPRERGNEGRGYDQISTGSNGVSCGTYRGSVFNGF